jgi:hypothetical protein
MCPGRSQRRLLRSLQRCALGRFRGSLRCLRSLRRLQFVTFFSHTISTTISHASPVIGCLPSSGRPKCSTVFVIHASTSSLFRTSTAFEITGTPLSARVLANCCTASPSMSARESSAPLFANSSAVARPMPEAAPVMAKRWSAMSAMAVIKGGKFCVGGASCHRLILHGGCFLPPERAREQAAAVDVTTARFCLATTRLERELHVMHKVQRWLRLDESY